jgi:hypothetical protein
MGSTFDAAVEFFMELVRTIIEQPRFAESLTFCQQMLLPTDWEWKLRAQRIFRQISVESIPTTCTLRSGLAMRKLESFASSIKMCKDVLDTFSTLERTEVRARFIDTLWARPNKSWATLEALCRARTSTMTSIISFYAQFDLSTHGSNDAKHVWKSYSAWVREGNRGPYFETRRKSFFSFARALGHHHKGAPSHKRRKISEEEYVVAAAQ